ncbi:hypothetical protein BDN72DRAFT_664561 [Pluteus cervinus]|uniref:Uncharacterized protein n=1 Tax=Pluteus cervinus TaxID=181527 RepID=A0ACD3BAE5_9AGAR|nr:hypothetical protein BDN72DRAFT_664561 [Pluteus cervinus]
MDIEAFRKAGYKAIDDICDYYYSLQEKSVVSNVKPGYLAELVPSEPPVKGEPFQNIANDYQKLIVPGLTHWQHPSFFAYYPTACTFEGMLGDLYASSASNPGFNWYASPACTELEVIVMDWAAKLLGLGPAFWNSSGVGGGCIQSTASDAALIAIVAARSLYQRTHPDVELDKLVIYTTTQTHSLGLKAGLILGLQVRALEVTSGDKFGLRGETLRKALEADTKAGKHPFILVATVGTTSSGAVDNLAEIKTVAVKYPSLWIHVDAAWAGVAMVCPEYREQCYLQDINDIAHSFCTNFHKWGLVNFDASTLWVRDRKYLTEALDVTPPFLRTAEGDAGRVIDYRNWHLALGRKFRSLKFWFVIRSYGIEGFQKYIRQSISLNESFAEKISQSKHLEHVTPPSFALSVFRLVPKLDSQRVFTLDELNGLNKQYYARISSRKDIALTQTVLNGVSCIRLAVGAAQTTKEHIEKASALLNEEAEEALKVWLETSSSGQSPN